MIKYAVGIYTDESDRNLLSHIVENACEYSVLATYKEELWQISVTEMEELRRSFQKRHGWRRVELRWGRGSLAGSMTELRAVGNI